MEELQLFIDMVKELPETALFVLAGYLFFKLSLVGSVYGVIRLFIVKLHDVLVFRKNPLPEVVEKDYRNCIDQMTIRGEADFLIAQIGRIRGINSGSSREYIHARDVVWLQHAIDEKIQREEE